MHHIKQDVWNKLTTVKDQSDLLDSQIQAMAIRHEQNIGRSPTALESRAEGLEALIIVLANRIGELENAVSDLQKGAK